MNVTFSQQELLYIKKLINVIPTQYGFDLLNFILLKEKKTQLEEERRTQNKALAIRPDLPKAGDPIDASVTIPASTGVVVTNPDPVETGTANILVGTDNEGNSTKVGFS